MLLGALPLYATEVGTDEAEPEEAPKTVSIVVATKDIPQGTYITDDYVTVVTVPNYNIPANAITDINEVITKYAKSNVYGGEYVASYQVSSKKVNKVSADAQLKVIGESRDDYLVVTDYILPDTGKDLTALLQKLIDENPKRTIYFPDGVYMLSATLKTSANGSTSNSIHLSDGAVLKAMNTWKKSDGFNALVSLGGGSPANNIGIVGSYYSLMGGILDGSGKADGVSIDSGRETLIRNVCIMNAERGIFINDGANNVSSDADIEDVTIIGSGDIGTIGMYFIGYDNSITNVRIYNVETGVYSKGAGNLFKNIQVINDPNVMKFPTLSVGFTDTNSWNNNWYSLCYAENCTTAFDMGNRSIIGDCSAKWTSDVYTEQTAIKMNTPVTPIGGFKAEFYGDAANTSLLKLSGSGSYKILEGCMANTELVDDKTYENYLRTPIMPISSAE